MRSYKRVEVKKGVAVGVVCKNGDDDDLEAAGISSCPADAKRILCEGSALLVVCMGSMELVTAGFVLENASAAFFDSTEAHATANKPMDRLLENFMVLEDDEKSCLQLKLYRKLLFQDRTRTVVVVAAEC